MIPLLFLMIFSQALQSPEMEKEKINLSIADDILREAKVERGNVLSALELVEIISTSKQRDAGSLIKVIRCAENHLKMFESIQGDAGRLSIALLEEIKRRDKEGSIDRDERLRCMATYQTLKFYSKISLKDSYKKLHRAAMLVNELLNIKTLASSGKPELSYCKNSLNLGRIIGVLNCLYLA